MPKLAFTYQTLPPVYTVYIVFFPYRMPPEERAHRIVEGMRGWFERPLSEKHQLDEYMRRQHAIGIEEYKKELAVTLSQPQKIIHGFGHRFLFCPSKKVPETDARKLTQR